MARWYWRGFAAGAMMGAGAATGALLFTNIWGRAGHSRIIRLEKSVQIGRPVEEVFNAWRQLEMLPGMSHRVIDVRSDGTRSHWRVRVNRRDLEWDAEVEQLIPNQAIGWKSISGPKHTGRISFAQLGNDTLVHLAMNYAPPSRILRPFLAPMVGNLEGSIEAVLRDFKHSLENMGSQPTAYTGSRSISPTVEPGRATGTFGAAPPNPAQTSDQQARVTGPSNPVDFTAPPEAKR